MWFFILIFIGLPVLGWYVGVKIYDGITEHKEDKNTYITHNHYYYDNRSVTIQQEENHQLNSEK